MFTKFQFAPPPSAPAWSTRAGNLATGLLPWWHSARLDARHTPAHGCSCLRVVRAANLAALGEIFCGGRDRLFRAMECAHLLDWASTRQTAVGVLPILWSSQLYFARCHPVATSYSSNSPAETGASASAAESGDRPQRSWAGSASPNTAGRRPRGLTQAGIYRTAGSEAALITKASATGQSWLPDLSLARSPPHSTC